MAEILPELLGYFDSRKQAAIRQIAQLMRNPTDALAQQLAQAVEGPREQGQIAAEKLGQGDYQGVTNAAMQMVGPNVGRGAGTLEEAAAAAKAQLAPYQHAVFDRLFAATRDPQAAFQKTRELTNLMAPYTPR